MWREAFDWLRRMPAAPAEGIQRIRGDDVYVNVMRYQTLPRERCLYESHRCYVDLQYAIEGSELIECRRSSELQADGGYHAEKDLQLYQPADSTSRIHLRPGCFGIFFPCDAHRPKIADGQYSSVHKLVIKVRLIALEEERVRAESKTRA
jgi:biofilm protein TabA